MGPFFSGDRTTSEHVENENTASVEPVNTSDAGALFILKCVAVPTAAMFSALSLPLSIIAVEKRFFPDINTSLDLKILQTLLPYSVLVGFRTWLLWYRIGQRLDGQPDKVIERLSDTQEDASMAVFAAMMANISGFTNGFLVMLLVLQKTNAITAGIAGIALGLLSYITDLLTDVADAFRKYVEVQDAQGKHIHPLFKQKIIQDVFQSHIEKLGVFLREALPIVVGVIRSQTTAKVVSSLLEHKISDTKIRIINLFLCLMVYEASACFAKFDVIQLHDNLKACGLVNFNLENTLVNAQHKPVRLLGKLVNGELLIDIFQALKMSVTSRVNAAYAFATIGFITLIFTAFQSYVSSTNTQAVQDDKEGLLMHYYLGEKKALAIAPNVLIGTAVSAVMLGAVGLFAQKRTIREYIENQPIPARENQVLPTQVAENDIEAQDNVVVSFFL
jgi:hypothetical protein